MVKFGVTVCIIAAQSIWLAPVFASINRPAFFCQPSVWGSATSLLLFVSNCG
jgi:hypothetical protein